MSKDLISVIIPVYNTQNKDLGKCVQSIIEQDYRPIEIVIVDDGSTNSDTINFCDELGDRYTEVRVFHKINQGLSSARNYGVSCAKGEFISFIDSDDYIDSNAYSMLMNDIHQYNVKVALGCLVINDDYSTVHCSLKDGVYSSKEIMRHFLLGEWHSACTNLYYKNLFISNNFPEGEINEDYIFNFSIINSVDKISVNSKPWYHYIKHPNSITTSQAKLKHLDWVNHTDFVRKTVQQKSELNLNEEADFQSLFCHIVLANKSLISISEGYVEEPQELFQIVTQRLKEEKKLLWNNPFLNKKYRMMGLALSYIPNLYSLFITTLLKLKKWKK